MKVIFITPKTNNNIPLKSWFKFEIFFLRPNLRRQEVNFSTSMKECFDKLSLWNATCTEDGGQHRAGLRATRCHTTWSCQKYFSCWWYEGLARFPQKCCVKVMSWFNPLNAELNPICYLLALLAHHFLHVNRIRVKSLTLRLLISYIYGAPILDVSRSHT